MIPAIKCIHRAPHPPRYRALEVLPYRPQRLVFAPSCKHLPCRRHGSHESFQSLERLPAIRLRTVPQFAGDLMKVCSWGGLFAMLFFAPLVRADLRGWLRPGLSLSGASSAFFAVFGFFMRTGAKPSFWWNHRDLFCHRRPVFILCGFKFIITSGYCFVWL